MAGFLPKNKFVEGVFRRKDEKMTHLRQKVAHRVLCNDMTMWAVCGSAVACGAKWDIGISDRTMPMETFQCFEILHDGVVDYQSSSGGSVIVCEDGTKWHISSGTATIISTNKEMQHVPAFHCVTRVRESADKHLRKLQPRCQNNWCG